MNSDHPPPSTPKKNIKKTDTKTEKNLELKV